MKNGLFVTGILPILFQFSENKKSYPLHKSKKNTFHQSPKRKTARKNVLFLVLRHPSGWAAAT
jgi:hypothetical protein